MLLAIQTGLRVSELTRLNCRDGTLGAGVNIRCEGKDASNARSRSPVPSRPCYGSSSANEPDTPMNPCSRPAPAAGSAACRRAPGQYPRRLSSPEMHVATRQEEPPTRPETHLRHVAFASRRRHLRDRLWLRHAGVRSTDARTCRHQHRGEGRGPHHPLGPPSPVAIARPTRCSCSSKACNNAEHRPSGPLQLQAHFGPVSA